MYVDPDTVCRNGGVWSSTTQSCTCPPGFVGMYCEEGCGPNRYGENCSKPCSFLSSACEGLIFCTKELCSCAPGLQGAYCGSPCDSRNYGASCRQRCGKCKDDEPCDRYTGMCYTGCYDGFYPPFCQQTYKVLGNAPDVIEDNYKSLKIRISFENVTGEGEPVFYEVQYKEEKQYVWSKLSPRVIPNATELGITAELEIMGLLAGKNYEIRVILIDKDGGSYQTDVPESKARTKCIDPVQGDYKFAVSDVDDTSVLLEWSYEHDKTSLTCEILDFELSVLCGSENLKFLITEKNGLFRLSDIMPDMTYNFQLTGKTVTGNRTLPTEIEVHTLAAGPGRVRAANAAPSPSGRQLRVTWLPPWNSQGQSLRYKVRYQCVYFLACEDVNCDASSGDTEVSTTAVVLDHLHSHALYQIEITSVSVTGLTAGSRIINAVTAHTAPHVAPSAAENPIFAVSNTSVSLSWMPPEDCTGLNGYIYGYHYSLVENNTDEIIQQGTVAENILNVNFTNLTPSNCYDAYITVVASGGTSDSDQLNIPFCTSSTASTPPVNLRIINATDSSMLVEWGMPDYINGQLRSFIIIVEQIDMQINSGECCDDIPLQDYRVTSEEPFYLYEITGLSAASTYSVTVSAKTVTLGEESRVIGHTFPPKAILPQNALMVVKTESSSHNPDVVTLQMHPAESISGVNRTYILLHLINDSSTQQPFYDSELTTLLKSRLTENYHLISEYTQEEVENQSVVTFHLKEMGFVSTEIESQKYALILIQDYMGNQSMDVFITEETG
ncbi:immunoglobulin superfamily DCC subclass member 4-like isoform X2 [Schistocerca americana]|uniref:immunoglobulin superfamily DCC subclass member 4-like isoform X2 n=1 Tax=Schistocerca americana TaxID=7009 RepID=UPI001F500A33|nr:immunoglobulin superfamily DCC subclass member 4-like isoform X2 [Schistocerca americana]